MMNTSSTDSSIVFPPTTRPDGATPAIVGTYVGDEPLYLHTAEGTYRYSSRESVALKFPHHTAGQAAALVFRTPSAAGRIGEVTIAEGTVTQSDIEAIAQLRVRRLILGSRRGTKGFKAPLELPEDLTLAPLLHLPMLEAHAIGFREDHLATLPKPHLLECLALDETPVSPELLSRCTGLVMLTLAGVDGIGEDLSFVAKMPRLELLGIRFSDLAVEDFADLEVPTDLEMLDVGYNPGVGPDLAGLPSRYRRFLDLSTTAVDDSSLETLEAPWLDGLAAQCTGITDASVEHLPSTLTKLNLAGNDLSDDGLARIVTTAPGLTELDLRAVSRITPDGLRRWLPALVNLRTLGVSPNLIDGDLARELDATTGLEHLLLGGPVDDERRYFEAIDVIGSATFAGTPV